MKYGIVVVTAIFYVTVTLHFEYTPDASYVSFRVASNVAHGEGFVFNPGELSVGTGGPIWSLILAGGIWGGLDAPLVAKTFDLVFACLALFAVYFLAYLILRDKVAAFFVVLLFSVDAWVLRSSASGLGISLALLLVVMVLWYGFKREYRIASFVCGFLILTAPMEGILLFGVMMIDAIALWRREKVLPGPVIRSVALALISVLPWLLYVIFTSGPTFTGPPVGTFMGTPLSGPSGESAGAALYWYAASGGVMIVLLFLGHAVAVWRSNWRLLAPSSFPLLWALLSVGASLLVNPGGLDRTWVLVAPVVAIYGLMGLYYLSMFLIGIGRKSTVALFLAVVMSLFANQVVYRSKVLPEINRTVIEMQEQVRPLAYWIRSRISSDQIVLAPFAGMVGWASGVRVHANASLWIADESSAQDEKAKDFELLREALSSARVAMVVDRSASETRLEPLNLVAVRSWDGGTDGVERRGTAVYTVYVDPSRRDSILGSDGRPGSQHNGN